MATAEEKQAKQDTRDAARQSITVGQSRLQSEVGQASSAFPQRRLRTAGDLTRYAIGGFLSDPNAPLPVGGGAAGGGAKNPPSGRGTAPPPKPRPTTPPGSTGSGVTAPRRAPVPTRPGSTFTRNPGGGMTVPYGGWGSAASQAAHRHPPSRTSPSHIQPLAGTDLARRSAVPRNPSASLAALHVQPKAGTNVATRSPGSGTTSAKSLAALKGPAKQGGSATRSAGTGTTAAKSLTALKGQQAAKAKAAATSKHHQAYLAYQRKQAASKVTRQQVRTGDERRTVGASSRSNTTNKRLPVQTGHVGTR